MNKENDRVNQPPAMDQSRPQQPSLQDIQRYVQQWGAEPLVVHEVQRNVYWFRM